MAERDEKKEKYLIVPLGYLQWVFPSEEEARQYLSKLHEITGIYHTVVQIGGLEEKVEEAKKKAEKEELTLEEVAKKYNLLYFSSIGEHIQPEATTLFSKEVAKKHEVMPMGKEGDSVIVAMHNPKNIFAIDDLKFITGYNIKVVVAPKEEIEKAITKYYVVS